MRAGLMITRKLRSDRPMVVLGFGCHMLVDSALDRGDGDFGQDVGCWLRNDQIKQFTGTQTLPMSLTS